MGKNDIGIDDNRINLTEYKFPVQRKKIIDNFFNVSLDSTDA